MATIQLNATGTHHLEVSEKNLATISKYSLFSGLTPSAGFVTENELDKLKLNIRALIASRPEDTKDLLDLCIDVVYHDKMKAYGLRNLIAAWKEWEAGKTAESAEDNAGDNAAGNTQD